MVALFVAISQLSGFSQDATTYPLQTPVDPARVSRLQSHGLAPVPKILVYFLENGFAPGTQLADLPTTPGVKSQIVIDAIVEVARQRVLEATPALVAFLRGAPPAGVRRIIGWDVSRQRSSDRRAYEERVLRTFRLNAIVALGLIGDLDQTYELLLAFEREENPGLRIPCALALATVGSRTGLPYLVREVRRVNRTTSVEAAEALRLIAGHDYGPGADDPVARRKEAAEAWKNWWKSGEKTFRPDREAILARRLTPPIRPLPREPQTVRELVDRIAYPQDTRWTIDSYDAYDRLRLLGVEALDGLEKIIADKKENLRIRRQAILLYTQMATVGSGARPLATRQPKRAYRAIKRLRWDRNPEIREVVRDCRRRLKGEL